MVFDEVHDVSGMTRFSFNVNYKGTPAGLPPPQPIDCTDSDVDQIQVGRAGEEQP
jgi:hypothetical protein